MLDVCGRTPVNREHKYNDKIMKMKHLIDSFGYVLKYFFSFDVDEIWKEKNQIKSDIIPAWWFFLHICEIYKVPGQ